MFFLPPITISIAYSHLGYIVYYFRGGEKEGKDWIDRTNNSCRRCKDAPASSFLIVSRFLSSPFPLHLACPGHALLFFRLSIFRILFKAIKTRVVTRTRRKVENEAEGPFDLSSERQISRLSTPRIARNLSKHIYKKKRNLSYFLFAKANDIFSVGRQRFHSKVF